MKNKNGILLPETLKIIIAVVGIALLVYLAISIYGIFVKSSALKQAELNLNKISVAIDKIESKEKKEIEIFLESPEDWWMLAWPHNNLKPAICKGEYCICLCPVAWGEGGSSEECDVKGVCKDVSIKINVDETFLWWWKKPLTVDGFVKLKIYLEKEEIVIKEIEK